MMVHVGDTANTYNATLISVVDSDVFLVYVFGQLATK